MTDDVSDQQSMMQLNLAPVDLNAQRKPAAAAAASKAELGPARMPALLHPSSRTAAIN